MTRIDAAGITYFLTEGKLRQPRSGSSYFVKVGFTSRTVEHRVAECQTGNPRPLSVFRTLSGTAHEEKLLHRAFAAYRYEGEWFRLPTTVLIPLRYKRITTVSDFLAECPQSVLPDCRENWYQRQNRLELARARGLEILQSRCSELQEVAEKVVELEARCDPAHLMADIDEQLELLHHRTRIIRMTEMDRLLDARADVATLLRSKVAA